MSRTHLLPDAGSDLDLHQAIYCAARDYRGGLTALAAILAMPYNTLQKKISIAEHGHHLTLPEFEALVAVLDDQRVDEAYARHRGFVLYRPDQLASPEDAMQALAGMLRSEAEFVDWLFSSLQDGKWSAEEADQLQTRGNRLIAHLVAIVQGARDAVQED